MGLCKLRRVIPEQICADVRLSGVIVGHCHNITQAQRTLAQSLADWGADVIIGTHPHVLQDAEWRTAADGRNVFVAYSLGNFLSTQSKPDQLFGAILTLDLEQTTEPDGSVHCAVRCACVML